MPALPVIFNVTLLPKRRHPQISVATINATKEHLTTTTTTQTIAYAFDSQFYKSPQSRDQLHS